MFLRGWLVESLPGGRGTLGHVFWPVAHVVILVEDQARRTRLVMLGAALTHIVHAAVLLVPVESHMGITVLTVRYIPSYVGSSSAFLRETTL